jgi:tetratricopeptide (TPR) repeat protein
MAGSDHDRTRIAYLEQRSAQLEAYERRLAELEEENRGLRERLRSYEPPQPTSSRRRRVPALPRLPFADPMFDDAVARQDWDAALVVLEEHHAQARDPRVRVRCLCHIGAMALDALGDLDHAATAFIAALAIDPHLEVAVHHLAAIYRATNSYTQLEELLAHRATLPIPDDERLALYLELGDINETHLGDPSAAADAFAAALEVDPSNHRATAALQRLGRL